VQHPGKHLVTGEDRKPLEAILARLSPVERVHLHHLSPEKVENVYGCCPVCGMNDGYVNLGDEHWFYCWEHKKRWKLGSEWFTPIRSKGDGTTSAEEALEAYEPVPLRMTWPD
jgi:hypothetical protein